MFADVSEDYFVTFVELSLVINITLYQSGEFYLRELPYIMSLLKKIDLSAINTIVINGYVYLNEKKIGLDEHLYHEFNGQIPIIG